MIHFKRTQLHHQKIKILKNGIKGRTLLKKNSVASSRQVSHVLGVVEDCVCQVRCFHLYVWIYLVKEASCYNRN